VLAAIELETLVRAGLVWAFIVRCPVPGASRQLRREQQQVTDVSLIDTTLFDRMTLYPES